MSWDKAVAEPPHLSVAEWERRCAESLKHSRERRAQPPRRRTWPLYVLCIFLVLVSAFTIIAIRNGWNLW